MSVRELIKRLQAMDQEATVAVNDDCAFAIIPSAEVLPGTEREINEVLIYSRDSPDHPGNSSALLSQRGDAAAILV